MDKVEGADWRYALKFLSLFILCAALIYLGGQTLVLMHELSRTECAASYWRARALGQPLNYCPPGCACYPGQFQ